jgi:hypothetical protein
VNLWERAKEDLYRLVKLDSRNATKIGKTLGSDYMEQEGKKNTENPGRGLGKGAAAAATWYLGGAGAGALGGAGAGAGGAAAGAAGGAAASTAADLEMQLAQQQIAQMLAQQAAQEAAKQGITQGGSELAKQGLFSAGENALSQAPSSLASSGMFQQVPGVTGGGPQWQALAEQNAGFGGQGWNSTAQAAMDPVKQAYGSGNMNFMDYAGNKLKADAAGMSDPSVWLDRAKNNLGRMAGNAGKNVALNAAGGGQQQQGAASMPPPQQQARAPAPVMSDVEKQKLFEDFKSGRITEDELRKRLGLA